MGNGTQWSRNELPALLREDALAALKLIRGAGRGEDKQWLGMRDVCGRAGIIKLWSGSK